MFSSYPWIFTSYDEANDLASTFQMETGEEWIVVCKNANEHIKWYKPCLVKDYTYDVKADGWVIVE